MKLTHDIRRRPTDAQGAIAGTATTVALDDPNAETPDDFLIIVALVEDDDHDAIDGIFTQFAHGMDTRFSDGRNGTIVLNSD